MVEIVPPLPPTGRHAYPWNQWLDGQLRAINCNGHPQPDVPVTRKTLRTYAYWVAGEQNIKVACNTIPDQPYTLYIQASR